MSPMINGEFVEPTNEDRAVWAHQALISYGRLTRHDAGDLAAIRDQEPEVIEEVVGDLLSDLRHLADALQIDFDEINAGARRNYQEELDDE